MQIIEYEYDKLLNDRIKEELELNNAILELKSELNELENEKNKQMESIEIKKLKIKKEVENIVANYENMNIEEFFDKITNKNNEFQSLSTALEYKIESQISTITTSLNYKLERLAKIEERKIREQEHIKISENDFYNEIRQIFLETFNPIDDPKMKLLNFAKRCYIEKLIIDKSLPNLLKEEFEKLSIFPILSARDANFNFVLTRCYNILSDEYDPTPSNFERKMTPEITTIFPNELINSLKQDNIINLIDHDDIKIIIDDKIDFKNNEVWLKLFNEILVPYYEKIGYKNLLNEEMITTSLKWMRLEDFITDEGEYCFDPGLIPTNFLYSNIDEQVYQYYEKYGLSREIIDLLLSQKNRLILPKIGNGHFFVYVIPFTPYDVDDYINYYNLYNEFLENKKNLNNSR